MKKIYTLTLAVLLGITASAQVPTSGLVGYWPFNGNADDESGNSNNGTVNGATLTTDRFGNADKAYSFDGVDDYISIPYSNSLDIVNSSFSISLWKTSTLFTAQPMELYWYGDFQGGMDPYYIWSSNNEVGVGRYAGDGTNSSDYRGIFVTQSNNTEHFVANFDISTNTYSIYINGTLANQEVMTSSSNINYSTSDFFTRIGGLGPGTGGWGQFYNGSIDDVRIYNRALNQSEITALYNENQVCLVAHYPFTGSAVDISGNNNHGTVNGATLTTDRFGNINSAYSFEGTNEILIPNATEFNFDENTDFSISTWIKIDPFSDNWRVFLAHSCTDAQFTGGATGGFQLGVNNTTGNPLSSEFGSTSSEVLTTNIGLTDYNWHHIVYVINRNNDYVYEYINGILVDTVLVNSTWHYAPTCNPELRIGSERNNNNIHFFKGAIDDLKIYKCTLTETEISTLFNEGLCYQTITVTDTLIINANLSGYNPITFQNTIKVYPNPANDQININYGSNYSTMNGYSLKITNSLGQTVFTESIASQQTSVDLNTWSGNGVYFIYLIDSQSNILEVRKIVLQ